MMFDNEILPDGVYRKFLIVTKDMINLQVADTDDYYYSHRMHVYNPNMKPLQIYNRHIMNWLFTIKCETCTTGLRYIEIVLQALKRTLDSNMNEIQFAYVKMLLYLFLRQYKIYKRICL